MSKTRAQATVKAPMFSSRLMGALACWCGATSRVVANQRRRTCRRIAVTITATSYCCHALKASAKARSPGEREAAALFLWRVMSTFSFEKLGSMLQGRLKVRQQ